MKKITLVLIIFISIFSMTYAHSGRTDSSGGHYDSYTGEYHYHQDESVVIGTEEEGQEIIDDYEKQIEELQEEIRNKEENIEELNREIEEKDNKIEQLEDDKQALHCIYWFVIICMGIFIWNSIKND